MRSLTRDARGPSGGRCSGTILVESSSFAVRARRDRGHRHSDQCLVHALLLLACLRTSGIATSTRAKKTARGGAQGGYSVSRGGDQVRNGVHGLAVRSGTGGRFGRDTVWAEGRRGSAGPDR